ncbi:hypothetical protein D3C81_2289580 [compost metagenome]
MRFLNVLYQVINAQVVEAHAVDQTFCVNQTEKTWLIITRLRTWRHGAYLN